MFDSFFNNNTGDCVNNAVPPSDQIILFSEVGHA